MARKILIRLNLIIFICLGTLNLLGVLMPELGFDALWYHLTLSKLFLTKHQWYFSGGLYYYSAMPRLGELISLPLMELLGYVGPKLLQFFAGLTTCFFIFKIVKKLTDDKLISLTAINLFYGTWLVSWQSSSAYVDLIRTVFEIVALYFLTKSEFINYKSKIIAGFFLGLAIGVKWQALGSLLIYAVVFSPLLVIPALFVASPWFFVAFHFTGNPLFPLFEKFMTQTQLSQVGADFFSPLFILARFLFAPVFLTKPIDDFISPVVGLVYIISLLSLVSSNAQVRRISLLGVLGTFYLLVTPPPSSRYFLPFLPALIISAAYIIFRLKEKASQAIIIIFSLSSILIFGMRIVAFTKYLPYLAGRLSRNQFLMSLNHRLPDTFIDADDYVSKNLSSEAKYLISNKLHNLYYFPFDFDHESFAKNKRYDYLITKDDDPDLIDGQLIHANPIGIQIYKL